MYWKLAASFALLVLATIFPIALIMFSAPSSPPTITSITAASRQIGPQRFPTPRRFRARDGASLQYYAYPAEPDKVAILVHGSAGPGTSMLALADALHAAGVTTYALDIRGHGGSGRRGDIDYVGQIDDDLADFVAQLGPARSGETRTLIGFSAGAGFAIRFAGGPNGLLFDRYVFLAPILPGSPALRPNAGGWTDISWARVFAIASLDRLGIHWFDGLPVISYAITPQMSRSMTASYSYRLMTNFGAGPGYGTYLRNIRRPAAILVGTADEQLFADQLMPLMQRLGVNLPVTLVPHMKHADMINLPKALEAVVRATVLQEPARSASFSQPGPDRG